jgi:predicted ATPase
MLYEMLTGDVPFKGSQYAIVIQHATVAPPPLPNVPVMLSSVVLRALAKNPMERFPSVLDLANAFAEALDAPSQSATVAINFSTLQPRAVPHNLPAELDQLLGREKEIAEIRSLLQQAQTRLVNLTGIGGTGKTRLSLAVGQALLTITSGFTGGIYFLPVENVTERDTLLATLAQTLEVKEVAGLDLFTNLTNFLGDKHFLLILDNFEQLVANGAMLVSELLNTAPNLKMLITSREILNLSQEIEYKVDPLTVPTQKETTTSTATLREYAAIALFEQRARAVKPDFALTDENIASVVEICNRLDGLPLAIELAAARVKMLPPAKLLERLNLKLLAGGRRDLPQRQQALRSAIDWSYDLLSDGEKQLLCRLAIFAGGATLDSAEAICNADADLDIDLRDGLQSLLNKSLLRPVEDANGEFRYTMLQTIRQYALEKLDETGETRHLNRGYVNYIIQLAETFEAKLETAEQLVTLKRYENEYTNIQEVLYQMLENADGDKALRLAAATGRYWRIHGHWSEGRNYLVRALALDGTAKNRARALLQLGTIALLQTDKQAGQDFARESLKVAQELNDKKGIADALILLANSLSLTQLEEAHEHYEQALALYNDLGNKAGIANALQSLGGNADERGDPKTAKQLYEESLALRREIGVIVDIAATLNYLAAIVAARGDRVTGRRYFEESLALRRQIGDIPGITTVLGNLGIMTFNMSDYDASQKYIEESLQLLGRAEDKRMIARLLGILSQLATVRRDYVAAAQYFDESLKIARETGDKVSLVEILNNGGKQALKRDETDTAQPLLEEARQIAHENGYKSGLANVLDALGSVALRQNDFPAAETLYREAFAIRQQINDRFLSFSYHALGNLATCTERYADARNFYTQELEILKSNSTNLWTAHALAGLTGALTRASATQEVYVTVTAIAGKVYALLNLSKNVLDKPESDFYEKALEAVRTALGSESFRSNFAKGQKLSLEEIIGLLSD